MEKKENKNELYVFVTAEEKTLLNNLSSVPQNIQKTFKSLFHQTAESMKKNRGNE